VIIYGGLITYLLAQALPGTQFNALGLRQV
jgi:hypothetical protein